MREFGKLFLVLNWEVGGMKIKKLMSVLLVICLVSICNVTAFPLAAEKELSLTENFETSNVGSETGVRSTVVSIPYYYYFVYYKDGSYYRSATVYHSVTVPTGKKVVVGDAKAVLTTTTYNGVEVNFAIRYEYEYWFE